MRIRIIGSREGLVADILDLIDESMTLTKDNTRLTLNIAFNYGGRGEIVAATRASRQGRRPASATGRDR